MKWLGALLLIVATFVGEPTLAQQVHISTAQLEDMFANIRAKTTWEIDGDMLWGYFFTSPNRGELERIGVALASDGYRLVEIRERESDSPEETPEWQLHVERVEHHTVVALYNRNIQFEGIARQHRDVIYDGMDVGPPR